MVNPLWTHSEADTASGGISSAPWSASGVSIDTRTLVKGDLFIAIRGDQFDGHNFIQSAINQGASAILLDTMPKQPIGIPYIKTNDTFKALQDLSRYARNRTDATIIAITGSVGKTSTKEALKLAFSSLGPTMANKGGLNNHLGLPLSLARLPKETKYGIFEMGMNHPGELSELTDIARPHIAIITNVEEVHKEFFSSIEEIAKAKAEIFKGLEPNGTAIVNRDSHCFDILQQTAQQDKAQIVTYGAHIDSDIRLRNITICDNNCNVKASINDSVVNYSLNTPARHLAFNSLAVLASIKALNLDMKKASQSLSNFTSLQGRGEQQKIVLENGSFLLIDESYNASPVAVRAALEVLNKSPLKSKGRRIFIFGDMGELGCDSAKFHANLAQDVLENEVDLVYSCGPLAQKLSDALPPHLRGLHKNDSGELAQEIGEHIQPNDIVLVKGSFSTNMKLIVDQLKKLNAESGYINAL
jgi:UDP-N-acetylmuramoyl-tripeptide--D-alanyl-D-alanine ligase